MAKVALPRYTRAKKIKSGTAYFWEPPHWARKGAARRGRACPIISTPLGQNLAKALEKAEHLNEALDTWRKGEDRAEIPSGSVAWLFRWYRSTIKFKRLSAKTKSDYRKLMAAVAGLPMKRGTFGQRNAISIDAEVADKLYQRFQERGERQATYAMQVCRLIWNWAGRYSKQTGIQKGANPFAGMALNHKVAKGNRPATREEYNLYREAARRLGFQSMASAAALSFELVQRVSDVFGFEDPADPDDSGADLELRGIRWEHYEPGHRITVRQHKTRKLVRIPLSDGRGRGREQTMLYPELEEELERLMREDAAGLIIVEERNSQPYQPRRMSEVHRKICNDASLPKDLTFTGFRHGGLTEIGDAGETDMRAISGHTQLNTTLIYNKANETKARLIALRRREHIQLISGEEAGDE